MDALNETQLGMLKAFHYLLQQNNRPRQVKPRFRYEDQGMVVHAKRCLTAKERSKVDELIFNVLDIKRQGGSDREIQGALSELGKLPVHFVPVKQQIPLKRGKSYPYASKRQGWN